MPFIDAEPFGINLFNSTSIPLFLLAPLTPTGIPTNVTTKPPKTIKVPVKLTLSDLSGSSITKPPVNKRVPVTVVNRPPSVNILPIVIFFQLSPKLGLIDPD
jgi:hypothetical protein